MEGGLVSGGQSHKVNKTLSSQKSEIKITDNEKNVVVVDHDDVFESTYIVFYFSLNTLLIQHTFVLDDTTHDF